MALTTDVVKAVQEPGNPWFVIGVGAVVLTLISWAVIASSKDWDWHDHDDHENH